MSVINEMFNIYQMPIILSKSNFSPYFQYTVYSNRLGLSVFVYSIQSICMLFNFPTVISRRYYVGGRSHRTIPYRRDQLQSALQSQGQPCATGRLVQAGR